MTGTDDYLLTLLLTSIPYNPQCKKVIAYNRCYHKQHHLRLSIRIKKQTGYKQYKIFIFIFAEIINTQCQRQKSKQENHIGKSHCSVFPFPLISTSTEYFLQTFPISDNQYSCAAAIAYNKHCQSARESNQYKIQTPQLISFLLYHEQPIRSIG